MLSDLSLWMPRIWKGNSSFRGFAQPGIWFTFRALWVFSSIFVSFRFCKAKSLLGRQMNTFCKAHPCENAVLGQEIQPQFRLMFQALNLRAKRASVRHSPGCPPVGFRPYCPIDWSLCTVFLEMARGYRCCHNSWCKNVPVSHILIALWLSGSSSSQKHL